MVSIKQKPYGLLLLAAIALSIPLVLFPVAGIDLQDKTMFSIPLSAITWLIPLFLLCSWLLYLLTGRFLYSRIITRAHVLLTVFTTILTGTILYTGIVPVQAGADGYYESPLADSQQLIGNAARAAFILFVFSQCIYIANVLLGLVYKKKSTAADNGPQRSA